MISGGNMDSVDTAGWGVSLKGHPFDLEEWTATLHKPFDPWVERRDREDGEVFILRSGHLDVLETAEEVRERAVPLVERLNGALNLMHQCEPLRFDAVARIDEHWSVALHTYVQLTGGRMRIRGGVISVTYGPDGQLRPAPPPVRSAAQRWAEASVNNDDLADLLVHLARADNWYDLYKSIELASTLAGGEHALSKFLETDAVAFKHFATTANYFRHAPGHAHRPSIPATFDKARVGVTAAVRRILEHLFPG